MLERGAMGNLLQGLEEIQVSTKVQRVFLVFAQDCSYLQHCLQSYPGSVRYVLETLVKYGAPERILVEGAPHLGTDNLVRLLRNMREDLRDLGGEIHFGTKASRYLIEDGKIKGVEAECVEVNERSKSKPIESEAQEFESSKTFYGDAVVLATGHSGKLQL